MGQVGRKIGVALAVVLAAACGSTSGSAVTLASYASGKWSCTSTARSPFGGGELKPTAVVTTTSSSTGRVAIDTHLQLPGGMPAIPTKFGGAWSVRSGELELKWDRADMGTLQAKPISLDTKQFRIRSGVPGAAKWSKVTVDRTARSVTFDYPVAITDQGPHATMTCRKP